MKKSEGKASAILLIIILILLFIMAGMYGYLYVSKLENRIIALETEKNDSQVEQNVLQQNIVSNQVVTPEQKEDEIKTAIKNYILTDFGPKNNMEEVTVISYEEVTAEKYLAVPSGDTTEEEIATFKEENPNAYYGYCIYSITFKDVNSISMAGSQPKVQEIVGDTMTTDAYFMYDKVLKTVKFATSYAFSN